MSKEVCIFTNNLESYNCGALFYSFVSLGYFLGWTESLEEAAAFADVVIECIVDDLAVKQQQDWLQDQK